ncbi:putative T6SS immunity periplasmic lipoprotein [Serratia rubidaea]|uniref:putative T6SS immunity periplasmic lipoprotein n=1 Tax=Serratia rubidaea TaxID=61652 RepID=UPI0020113BC5|nr:putative T6SS immunity periplasmic lipoprotein [Serratia rubidaea]
MEKHTSLNFSMTMIKTLTPLILASLLSGCFHLGDPRAKIYNASAVIVANHICVLIQPQGDEKMTSLSIDEPGNEESIFNKIYDAGGVTVSADKCIPTYNYPFKAGHTYTLSITLRSQAKKRKGIVPAARLYGVSFTLTGKDDELVISSIN